jgi:sulfur-oxidizing protein SoxA
VIRVLGTLAGTLLAAAALAGDAADASGAAPAPGARSGFGYLGEELRALQEDDFANPGMLWVDRGRALWDASEPGSASCRDCHGAPASLRGVAAGLPRWDAHSGALENLEMQINECRTERQNRPPWAWESEPLLATTTLVAHQSRGLPIEVEIDGEAAAAFAAGRREFERRRGQLDLSCANCHEANAGARLRGDVVSQGMVNGFPIYRLTWQTLGSRHRMFRWCNEAVRAQPHAFGADEYLALELYLAWRSRGLPIETPAVRR